MNRRLAVLAACLLATTAIAQTPTPTTPPPYPTVPYNLDYSALVEGKPVETRQNENKDDKPLYPEQTRAPYHKTAPYKLTEITSALEAPWALAFLPDGKFLVTERLPGKLRVVSPDGTIAPPVSGLEALNTGWAQTGLFDLALDPKFNTNRRIFFTFFGFDRGEISGIRVARATFNQAANSLSDVKVIFQARPQTPNDSRTGVGSRSGGRMAIGKDGYLYITIGDRDSGGQRAWRVAQTLDTHLGKILRITQDGKPAPGNPYIGQQDALPEIWAIGGRSQEGLAFDNDGNLWETEHGPRGGDELNLVKKGANYGWPISSHGIDYPGPPIGDGEFAMPGIEQPVYYWSPSMGISQVAFYKGNLFPEWKNSVFVSTLRGNSLERMTLANGKVVNEEPLLTEVKMRLRDVRVGPDGAVYVLSDSGGGAVTNNTPATSKLLKQLHNSVMAEAQRECGDCSLCCKVLRIPELDKPKDHWCANFAAGTGCRIYPDRPASCRDFACQWLTDPSMGPEWKPSICKLVLDTKPGLLVVHADPAVSKPWRVEPYNSVLRRLAAQGLTHGTLVMVMERRRSIVILPDREVDLGILDTGDRIALDRIQGPSGVEWRPRVMGAGETGSGPPRPA